MGTNNLQKNAKKNQGQSFPDKGRSEKGQSFPGELSLRSSGKPPIAFFLIAANWHLGGASLSRRLFMAFKTEVFMYKSLITSPLSSNIFSLTSALCASKILVHICLVEFCFSISKACIASSPSLSRLHCLDSRLALTAAVIKPESSSSLPCSSMSTLVTLLVLDAMLLFLERIMLFFRDVLAELMAKACREVTFSLAACQR